jgi:hypothetical protein
MYTVKKLFEDKDGRIVIAQRPNLPLSVGLTASVLGFVPLLAQLHELLSWLAFGALFTWAWLELFSGDSPFRRLLGLVILLWLLASRA